MTRASAGINDTATTIPITAILTAAHRQQQARAHRRNITPAVPRREPGDGGEGRRRRIAVELRGDQRLPAYRDAA